MLSDEEILRAIEEVAARHLGWQGRLRPETRLVEALRLDSLRALTLAVELENHFRIYLDDDQAPPVTAADLCTAIRRRLDDDDPD